MKSRIIETTEQALRLEVAVIDSANKALQEITKLHSGSEALATLWKMKFRPIGCDPLDATKPLNIIEQINQSFTYIASARAVRKLLELHPDLAPFKLNLGNVAGTDIESVKADMLACEVFAAVNTSNNRKLAKDVQRLAGTSATHRYVFFMCPEVSAGRQERLERLAGIQIWSVGGDVKVDGP